MGFIVFSDVALAPDEAQYWTWSQSLDWGYYSKPPGIAWQIFLTTHIFGNTELGVRFGAILLAFFLGLAVYRLGKNAGLSERACFWGAIIFAFSPLGMYLSFAATTDCGMILAIVLASGVVVKGLQEKKSPNYPLMGFWLLVGALYKWTAFIFYPFVFLFLIFFPWMRFSGLIQALLISLCALLPTLYWNATHDFATFKHVFYTVYHQSNASKGGNFFSFLAVQAALFSPLYFLLFLIALYKNLNNKKRAALLFCAVFSSGFLIYLILSLFKKIQPNWAAYFYPTGMILIAWYTLERMKRGAYVLYGATLLSLIFSFGVFFIPFLPIPYKWNPFRQSLGWQQLGGGSGQGGV